MTTLQRLAIKIKKKSEVRRLTIMAVWGFEMKQFLSSRAAPIFFILVSSCAKPSSQEEETATNASQSNTNITQVSTTPAQHQTFQIGRAHV